MEDSKGPNSLPKVSCLSTWALEVNGNGLGIAAFYCYPLLKAIIGCIPSFKVGGNGAKKESHLFA